jgi:8-hydroxy-5-deazaflavin:NADPH oxidoreductase
MNYGILGTGMVGQAIADRLSSHGHGVKIGTRNVAATLARTTPDAMGNPPFGAWQQQHTAVGLVTFADAAAFGEIVFNCTSGTVSLEALALAGENNLKGKILIDISNPLDFSKGMPPTLTVSNTDSIGEQIQRAHPELRVVKTLNTMNAWVMLNPALVPGEHTVFVCGNDADAKASATGLLKEFGWTDILDLGDISNARGVEMFVPLWVRVFSSLQTPMFNVKVAR